MSHSPMGGYMFQLQTFLFHSHTTFFLYSCFYINPYSGGYLLCWVFQQWLHLMLHYFRFLNYPTVRVCMSFSSSIDFTLSQRGFIWASALLYEPHWLLHDFRFSLSHSNLLGPWRLLQFLPAMSHSPMWGYLFRFQRWFFKLFLYNSLIFIFVILASLWAIANYNLIIIL